MLFPRHPYRQFVYTRQGIRKEFIFYYTTAAVEDGAAGVCRFCPWGSDGLAIARLDWLILPFLLQQNCLEFKFKTNLKRGRT
jgi:hypothetical protein